MYKTVLIHCFVVVVVVVLLFKRLVYTQRLYTRFQRKYMVMQQISLIVIYPVFGQFMTIVA